MLADRRVMRTTIWKRRFSTFRVSLSRISLILTTAWPFWYQNQTYHTSAKEREMGNRVLFRGAVALDHIEGALGQFSVFDGLLAVLSDIFPGTAVVVDPVVPFEVAVGEDDIR